MSKLLTWFVLSSTLLAGCGSGGPTSGYQHQHLGMPLASMERATEQVGVIFFVPGWGYDKSGIWRRATARYYRWLEQTGVASFGVIELDYDYTGTPEEIRDAISTAIASHMAKFPAGTTFDIIGHSFGAFAGLYGAVAGGVAEKMRQFVSLAGLPRGYNQPLCRSGWCGQAAALIVPIFSPFIQTFERDFANDLKKLRTCSVYSRADRILKPYNAGVFSRGINREISGMGHLAAATQKRFLHALLQACY